MPGTDIAGAAGQGGRTLALGGEVTQDFQKALLATEASAKHALGDAVQALLPLCGRPYAKAMSRTAFPPLPMPARLPRSPSF